MCGAKFDKKRDAVDHGREVHEIQSRREFDEISASSIISDAILEVWHLRSDLQAAFPNPCDLTAGFSRFLNFVDWVKQCGVRDHPELREALSDKE